ncbi:MAG TPA: hypothetical protein DCG57_19270 [Candidatus Riflebacteria bacterium]|nr:hypothetical protein [Candidatus Riflebacteria bacterium]
MKLKMIVLLIALLSGCVECVVASEAMLVEKRDGGMVLTNDPAVASGARNVKVIKQSEAMVFPTRSRKPVRRPRVERILTGIFSGRQDEVSEILPTEETYSPLTRRRAPARAKTAATIAWKTESGTAYHDPFLECATGSERIWVDNVPDLRGLVPCEECFVKTAHIPEFISKESGGLDLASAGALLDNREFLVWASERLPIKNPGFISTRRLLIYPKMEMTANGLQQLAKETELAYRRHTWRVIEVIAKMSETDTDSISSLGNESEGGGRDE